MHPSFRLQFHLQYQFQHQANLVQMKFSRKNLSSARKILEVLYNEPEEYWDAGDKLIEKGWIKVSAGPMGRYYHESGMYEAMTNAQYNSYQKWKTKYGIAYR